MKRMVVAGIAFAGVALSGCSMFASDPNVSVLKAEQKSTKDVDNIVVASVTGIDSTGNTGKAMLATAVKAYGTRSRPVKALDTVLSAIPLIPKGTANVLTVAYQAEFAKAVEAYAKDKKAKPPEALKLPSDKVDFKIPKGLDGMKEVASHMQGDAAAIGEIGGALASGNSKQLQDGVAKSPSLLSLIAKLDGLIWEKLDVTYILVTHVVGDEKTWESKKPVKLAVALVNAKTGKLRYFATVDDQKGMIPTPFMAQLTAMADNLFSAVGDKDALPEKKDSDDEKPAKKSKKSAVLYFPYE